MDKAGTQGLAVAPLLDIRGLEIRFRTRQRQFRALSGVDLTVGPGEAVGLVGESGSGKSITCLAALRLLGPRVLVYGHVLFDGRDLLTLDDTAMTKVRGGDIAMIFQDPSSSLNPVRKIGSQICESLRLHQGMDKESAMAEAKRLLDRVQIPMASQRLYDYPHQLSGGMNQRVMIAIALAGSPRLLVADEPTTALDATVQAQILDLLNEIRRDTGMAMVLISHDLGVVAENCDRVAVMYAGRVMETGGNPKIFDHPSHPYTKGLLAAIPPEAAPREIWDLGCGLGEQAALLARRFPRARVRGLDSSPEMLERAMRLSVDRQEGLVVSTVFLAGRRLAPRAEYQKPAQCERLTVWIARAHRAFKRYG